MLETGEMAPDFELTADNGEPVKLSDYRGQLRLSRQLPPH
jgi:peroxiredoxin